MPSHLMQPRFPLGSIHATPGALALNVDLARYLRRHHCGDWGKEPCKDDKQANEDALAHGTRLLSCYRTPAGDRLYIITESDRSITTLLLPEEHGPAQYDPHANGSCRCKMA
jgi:hypothetical protein